MGHRCEVKQTDSYRCRYKDSCVPIFRVPSREAGGAHPNVISVLLQRSAKWGASVAEDKATRPAMVPPP